MRLPMIVAGGFALTSLLFIACGDASDSNGETDAGDTETPTQIERPEVPEEFAGKTNPFSGDPEEIEKGRQLFVGTCATCHGDTGRGDGMAAAPLNPPVNDFTSAEYDEIGSDYLFWRITEGSSMEPFRSLGSAMTPFAHFDEEDRWRLVAFIESLRDDK